MFLWSVATGFLPLASRLARNLVGEGEDQITADHFSLLAAVTIDVLWKLRSSVLFGGGKIDGYLNNDKETRCKTIIWEEMNKEYLEEQEAVAAAKMVASQIDLENCSDEIQAAHELAAAAVAKSRKERKRKQDLNANPAQTAAEAAHQMPIKKPPSDLNKKAKASNGDGSDGEKEHDRDITDNYEELGQGYEDMEPEDATRIYSNGLHYENEEDFDDYNYDNGDDEYY
nr:hypothetical protein CFP56_77463 [Quercus suber]